MKEIADMTRRIVERAKQYEHDTIPGDFGMLKTPCPKCGGEVHEKYRQYQCVRDGCDFAMWKTLCSRMYEPEEIEKLIAEKQIGPLQGFRSKQGFPFAAVLKMNAEHKIEFDFGNGQGRDGEAAAPVDFTGKEPLGKCPKCGANVFDGGMNYVCEKAGGRGEVLHVPHRQNHPAAGNSRRSRSESCWPKAKRICSRILFPRKRIGSSRRFSF